MAKWAHTADGKPKTLLQFPPISRLKKNPYTIITKKGYHFCKKNFPLPVEADLNNIPSFIYLEPQTTKTKIKKEDIITVLKGLAFNKAPGLKKIIN